MVLCLGQLIVDFISLEEGVPLPTATQFEACLGGAAANVAIGLAHHGVPVRLCSRVGEDALGRFALDALAAHGLDRSGVVRDPERPTRFTRIGVDAAGEPALEVRNPMSADQAITLEDLAPEALGAARVLYVGGTMLLGEAGFRTTLGLLEQARARGLFVALDPNIRPSRTGHPDRVRARLAAVMPFVHLLQTNRRDWSDLWGEESPEAMIQQGLPLLVRTDGAGGACLQTRHHTVEVPAEGVVPVDRTGAGDAFLAALLARVVTRLPAAPVADLPEDALREGGRFATQWAARIVRHRGAVTAYRWCG